MSNKNKTLSTENLMIASDLKNAGFGIEAIPAYSAVRVYLTRKMIALPSQVRRALDQAGYEECQYTMNSTYNGVYVRAVSPA